MAELTECTVGYDRPEPQRLGDAFGQERRRLHELHELHGVGLARTDGPVAVLLPECIDLINHTLLHLRALRQLICQPGQCVARRVMPRKCKDKRIPEVSLGVQARLCLLIELIKALHELIRTAAELLRQHSAQRSPDLLVRHAAIRITRNARGWVDTDRVQIGRRGELSLVLGNKLVEVA